MTERNRFHILRTGPRRSGQDTEVKRSMARTEIQSFIEEEVNKVKGIYYPVKAGFLRRAFIKRARCRKLHPNPADEFCDPEIGPNYEILSGYEKDYRTTGGRTSELNYLNSNAVMPLMVEKTRPEGYMILNGHHRWAAAVRAGISKIGIHIVDLTAEKDVRKMIEKATSDRRVTLDLDEVVFRPEGDACVEKALHFPLNRVYKERIRLGIPALFHDLNAKGYDIWIYSAQYYSMEYLKQFFRHYHVRVTGIVTGTARKTPRGAETVKEMDRMVAAKYHTTLHIDNQLVLRTSRDSREFEEYRLSGSDAGWSREVMEIIGEMK